MKNSDIALIILVATVSVIASYFISNAIMGDANEMVKKIDYVKPVETTISEPSTDDFSVYMVNPTVDVYIGLCDAKTEIFDETTRTCIEKETDTDDGGDSKDDKDDKEKKKTDPDEE